MGIKVEIIEEYTLIPFRCPKCLCEGTIHKPPNEKEGTKYCLKCGCKLHWEETEG